MYQNNHLNLNLWPSSVCDSGRDRVGDGKEPRPKLKVLSHYMPGVRRIIKKISG